MPLVVYFDEVGNPTLDPSDKDFPVFAIALFICDSQCYINEIVPRVNQLKFDVFGYEGVILHSRDIRKAQGDFGFLTDSARRQPFYTALNEVMTTCDYKLIAVAIRKDRHAAQCAYPLNPYDLSLMFAMERLVSVLEGAQQTEVTIVAEKRGEREDKELHAAFQQIVAAGTAYVDQARFRRIRFTLKFLPKSMNIVGTQWPTLRRIRLHVMYSIARSRTRRSTSFDPSYVER